MRWFLVLLVVAGSALAEPMMVSTTGAAVAPADTRIGAIAGEHTTLFIHDADSCQVTTEAGMSARIWHIWYSNEEFAGSTARRPSYLLPPERWAQTRYFAVDLTPKRPGTHRAVLQAGSDQITITVEAIDRIGRGDVPMGWFFDPDRLARRETEAALAHMAEHGATTFVIYAMDKDEFGRIVDWAVELGIFDGSQPAPCIFNPEIQTVEARTKARFPDQWPRLYGYGWDEPGPEGVNRWHEWKLDAKWLGPSVTAMSPSVVYGAAGKIDWCLVKGRGWSRTLADFAGRHGMRLGTYDPYWQPWDANLLRYHYGIWAFKHRPQGMYQWAYAHTASSRVTDDWQFDQVRALHAFALSTRDGPMSSLGLKGFHEGTIDYRILAQLESDLMQHHQRIGGGVASGMARWLQCLRDHCGRLSWIGRIPDDADPFDTGGYAREVNWTDRDAIRVRAIECLRTLRAQPSDGLTK